MRISVLPMLTNYLKMLDKDINYHSDIQRFIKGIPLHFSQEYLDAFTLDLKVDYNREPVPPLPEADAAWVDGVLKDKGLR